MPGKSRPLTKSERKELKHLNKAKTLRFYPHSFERIQNQMKDFSDRKKLVNLRYIKELREDIWDKYIIECFRNLELQPPDDHQSPPSKPVYSDRLGEGFNKPNFFRTTHISTYTKSPSRAKYKSQVKPEPVYEKPYQQPWPKISPSKSRIPIRLPSYKPKITRMNMTPREEVYNPPPGTLCQTPKNTFRCMQTIDRGRHFEQIGCSSTSSNPSSKSDTDSSTSSSCSSDYY